MNSSDKAMHSLDEKTENMHVATLFLLWAQSNTTTNQTTNIFVSVIFSTSAVFFLPLGNLEFGHCTMAHLRVVISVLITAVFTNARFDFALMLLLLLVVGTLPGCWNNRESGQ